MGSPTNATDIGWYPGVKPGKGNALFDSHHDWNGDEGSFYRLEEMRPGDQVVVDGSKPGQRLVAPWRIDLAALSACGYVPDEIARYEQRMYDLAARRMAAWAAGSSPRSWAQLQTASSTSNGGP